MKKTIFKGQVNGKTFNDVASYNKAITEAINTGTLKSASSATEVVDVCEECECECNKNDNTKGCEDKCNKVMTADEWHTENTHNDLFPGFERSENYLDVLVTNDANKDIATMAELDQYLEEHKTHMTDLLGMFTVEALNEYATEIKDIMEAFNSNDSDCEKVVNIIDSKIQELQARKAMAKRGEKFTSIYRKYYTWLAGMINNHLIDQASCKACNTHKAPTKLTPESLLKFIKAVYGGEE